MKKNITKFLHKKNKLSLQKRFQKNYIWLVIILGFLTRLWLIYKLPMWGDEAYSIWAIEQPWLEIINNTVDPVHPPGYYVFLKLWGLISNHLFWMRLSSLAAFSLNIWLLTKLFIKTPVLQKIIITLYIFSGYFIIFDWQVRMYTPALSFIFASLLLQQYKKPIALFFLHIAGFLFDYAFFWYAASYTVFITLWEILQKKKQGEKDVPQGYTLNKFQRKRSQLGLLQSEKKCPGIQTPNTKSLLASLLVNSLWIALNFNLVKKAENGIGWAAPYLDPNFHIPYFFGTHKLPLLAIFFMGFFIFGYWSFFKEKHIKTWQLILTTSSIFLYIGTLLSSLNLTFITFHIRSLEIIPFFFIFMIAKALEKLQGESRSERRCPGVQGEGGEFQRKRDQLGLSRSEEKHSRTNKLNKKIFLAFLIIYIANFITTIQIHLNYKDSRHGKLIVHFFDWKSILLPIQKNNTHNSYISIKEINTDISKDLIPWSFYYSAAGKETLSAKKIEIKLEPNKDTSSCQQIKEVHYWQTYLCPKDGL